MTARQIKSFVDTAREKGLTGIHCVGRGMARELGVRECRSHYVHDSATKCLAWAIDELGNYVVLGVDGSVKQLYHEEL